MSLMTDIKNKQVTARKAGSSVAQLYTTLLGEASAVGKNAGNRETTDAEVVAVVKKFIKNIDETISALAARNMDHSVFTAERVALEQFLPIQLSESDLRDIATTKATSMPDFMKYLKENHPGQYDGKMASAIAKSVF